MDSSHRLQVGQAIPEIRRRVSSLVMFSRQWAGTNPVHTDDAVAAKQGMPAPVATGQLSAAYIQESCVQLLGERMFRNAVMEVWFKRPVYLNDELTVRGHVAEVREEGMGSRIIVQAECLNQAGVAVTVARVEVVDVPTSATLP